MRLRKRLIGFIAIIQSVLFLTHFLLYETWTFSPAGSDTPGALWIKLVLGFLSVSFVAASLLAFRYTNAALRAFYRAAAIWVGLVTFLFLATVSSWIIFGVAWVAGRPEFLRGKQCRGAQVPVLSPLATCVLIVKMARRTGHSARRNINPQPCS